MASLRLTPIDLHKPVLGACLVSLAILAGCASTPPSDISLIPSKTDTITSKDGLFVQKEKWKRTQPDCKGECPSIELDSLVFPGVPQLNKLIDHALATMTVLGEKSTVPYSDIDGFERYFWKNAAPRDSVILVARTRYRNRHLTVVELNTEQYVTGAAHGVKANQFLNWHNDDKKVLGLDRILKTGRHAHYTKALERAHQRWLQAHADAIDDPASWERMWPFQESVNFAITDQGLVVKYGSYEIAPYSWGQPELIIPYSELNDVLRPEYLPTNRQ